MSKKQASAAAGLGCMILFLLPFFAGGIFVLGKGLSDLSNGDGFTESVIAALGIGSMFLLVSTCFFIAMLYGHKQVKEKERRKIEFPAEPWLWRADWAEGRIVSNSPAVAYVLWFFGVMFGGFGGLILVKFEEIKSDGSMAIAFALVFPAIGLLILASAVYKTLAYRKYGQAACELVTNPGVIGGSFKAAVRAKAPISPGDTANATLRCIHKYTTGSGKNKNTHRDTLWEEQKTIEHSGIGTDREGLSAFPVIVYIPRECRPTDSESDDEIIWELELTCDVPGIDFKQSWEVPVFVTAASSDTPPPEVSENLREVIEDQDYARTSRIRITPSIDGLEIYAPPGRAMGSAVMLGVFTAIWTGAIIFMIKMGAPLLFPIVFGLFDLLFLVAILSMLFGSVRTSIRNDCITVRSAILGIVRTKDFTTDNVESVDIAIGMQSGNNPYYRVNLHTTDDKNRTVAANIRDKNEARWLQHTLADHLGVPAKDAPSKNKRLD